VIDALIIVALGMAIIFAVLAVLLGVMVLLNRFLKPAETKDKQ
jgi:Na+-transporting methylmalonyl-CoA/oxaloacetate decarboxylase gamma subunit